MTTWLFSGTALACALMGGIFFAFSSFVMPALGRVPAEEGIRAMQRINIDVYHWSFMAAFFGTPLACTAAAIRAISGPASTEVVLYAVVGCLVYVLGNFVVTAAGNVPLNDALATVDPKAVEATHEWAGYLVKWTRWNHVRTAASMLAALFFLLALRAT